MLWLCSQCLLCYWFGERSKSVSARPSLREDQSSIPRGTFHSTQNSGISVGTSNGTDQFGLVRPEYSRPAIKAVHFDRSGHFGRLDRKIPFHLTKLLSPVPLFWILLTKTITKRAVAWVGSVQPECTVPLGTWNFRNFKPEFLLNGKCPRGYLKSFFRLLSFIQCSFKWFTFANLSLLLVTNVK